MTTVDGLPVRVSEWLPDGKVFRIFDPDLGRDVLMVSPGDLMRITALTHARPIRSPLPWRTRLRVRLVLRWHLFRIWIGH